MKAIIVAPVVIGLVVEASPALTAVTAAAAEAFPEVHARRLKGQFQ